LDRRAVRTGDDAALRALSDRLGIDLRHHQRHVRLHPKTGAVVDDDGPGLRRARRKDRRNLGPRRRKDNIDPTEIESVETLDLEAVILTEGNLLADRARRRQGRNIVGRKLAFGQRGQHLAPDIAGRADHGYFETHLETPRRTGWMMAADLRCWPP